MTQITQSREIDELPIPKLCRETLVAIEGLRSWDSEKDEEYLQFFSYLLDDLEAMNDNRRGSFPLLEQHQMEGDEEIVRTINDLNEFAKDLRSYDVKERKNEFSEEDVQLKIEEAEEVYAFFKELESEYTIV